DGAVLQNVIQARGRLAQGGVASPCEKQSEVRPSQEPPEGSGAGHDEQVEVVPRPRFAEGDRARDPPAPNQVLGEREGSLPQRLGPLPVLSGAFHPVGSRRNDRRRSERPLPVQARQTGPFFQPRAERFDALGPAGRQELPQLTEGNSRPERAGDREKRGDAILRGGTFDRGRNRSRRTWGLS